MTTWQILQPILILPFNVTIVLPGLLYYFTRQNSFYLLEQFPQFPSIIAGLLLIALGLSLVVSTNILFVKIGNGTLGPWTPTQKLVVKGPYRYVRNPMIAGVLGILLGEGILLRCWPILVWAALFFLVNHLYFIWKEEPDLEKRFGEPYRQYIQRVPRWIPRFYSKSG